MQWKNSSTRFGHISVLLHWLVALAVYGMFALGLWMVTTGYYDSWYHPAPELHKSIGMTLFAIMLFRVIWRFISPSETIKQLFTDDAIQCRGGTCAVVRHPFRDIYQWLPDFDR